MTDQPVFVARYDDTNASEGCGKFYAPITFPRFLVRLGEQWPHDPRRRLIQETTDDISRAKVFASEEDGRACLCEANAGKGWEVVPV